MSPKFGALSLALAALVAPVAAVPAFAQTADDAARLRALTDAIEQDQLDTSYYAQMRAGKPITQFGDYSLAEVRRRSAKLEGWSKTLNAIDPAQLAPIDRETYEMVAFDLDTAWAGDAEYWLTFDMTAYQAPMGIGFINQILAGRPFTSAADAGEYLRLVSLYADMLDSLAAKVAAQTAKSIYMPKPVLPVVRTTWSGIAAGLDGVRPADARLTGLDDAARTKLLAGVDALLARRLKPSVAKLNAIIGPDYESKAPSAVGLAQYPGGKDLYVKLVRRYTTLPLTPEQVKATGERDVAEVSARMAAIRKQLGSSDAARPFYDKISVDPRFLAKSTDDLEAIYNGYIERIVPKLPAYFGTLPKAPYGVMRLPLSAEAGQTFGYYSQPNPNEKRGLYYYNGSQLDKRSTINAGTLIYHELMPGHHMQIAIQEENTALSPYRRHYHAGAFSEGWGEYAASLGIEMGLYATPEQLYGRYVNEMFLTTRLVVDSGMNYFGWSLDQARAYMHEHTSVSDVEIASETLRYSTSIPGQALSYRIGYTKFWEFRQKAEKALGAKFDIRKFHDAVLLPGSRPLAVVEQRVDTFIADTK